MVGWIRFKPRPIRFKSCPRVSQILLSWTSLGVRPSISDTIVVLHQGYHGKFRGVVPDIKKWAIFPWCVSWSKNVFYRNTYHYIHNERVGRRFCIMSGLLCEPVLLRASMTRSCDAVSSRNWQDMIQCLEPTLSIYILNVYPLKLPTQTHDNEWHFNMAI